ncbi:MAG TPA: MFS transporter [Polyangiaceae bacterium]|nr:MFS transporter [Polyangiaceae bacterium]
MTTLTGSRPPLALLVFGSVLSSTLLIPGLRPYMAHWAPGSESAVHAFLALGLLGAVAVSPFVGKLARTLRSSARLATVAAMLDAVLLGGLALGGDVRLLFALRIAQGALNLTVLSVLLGAAPAGDRNRVGSQYGLLGAAIMLGVALGAPLGTVCLRFGVTGPIVTGAFVELSVALLIPYAKLEEPSRLARTVPLAALPWLPMLWVFAERLAVGLFVVTFALHAKECLMLTDAGYGAAISAFMVPFVLAVYPAGRLSDRFGAPFVASLALGLYGSCWIALAGAGQTLVLPMMLLLGVASAAIFAAGLRESATSRDVTLRIASMSALNSAGSLGMLVGTASAGILSAVLRSYGAESDAVHELIFRIAGVAELAAAFGTITVVLVLQRATRLVRS